MIPSSSQKSEQAPKAHGVTMNGTAILSGIGLLADVLGIAKLAFDVIVLGNLTDLGIRLVILVVVFFFGIFLGAVSLRGNGNTSLLTISKYFAWLYVTLACLSYIGIAFFLVGQEYNYSIYLAFVLIIATELLAVKFLQLAIGPGLNMRFFAFPILASCALHAILVILQYIFLRSGLSIEIWHLIGNLLFFIGMSLVGSALLGDFAFTKLLERTWRDLSKRRY
jgi:hypothetical protein